MRRRVDQRRDAERLLARAQHLLDRDRKLVEWVYREGKSLTDYARHHRVTRPTASRRLRRLMLRMHDPKFLWVANHQYTLPRHLRQTARMLYLEGYSLRDVARRRRKSFHTIRLQAETLKSMVHIATSGR